jgi:hypothetical protein
LLLYDLLRHILLLYDLLRHILLLYDLLRHILLLYDLLRHILLLYDLLFLTAVSAPVHLPNTCKPSPCHNHNHAPVTMLTVLLISSGPPTPLGEDRSARRIIHQTVCSAAVERRAYLDVLLLA